MGDVNVLVVFMVGLAVLDVTRHTDHHLMLRGCAIAMVVLSGHELVQDLAR